MSSTTQTLKKQKRKNTKLTEKGQYNWFDNKYPSQASGLDAPESTAVEIQAKMKALKLQKQKLENNRKWADARNIQTMLNRLQLKLINLTNMKESKKAKKQTLMSELLEAHDITSKLSRKIIVDSADYTTTSPDEIQRQLDILLHIDNPSEEERAEIQRLMMASRAKVVHDPVAKLTHDLVQAERQKEHHIAHLQLAHDKLENPKTSDYVRKLIKTITIPEQEKFIHNLTQYITKLHVKLDKLNQPNM